jgi:hypothetical protein
VHFIGPAGYREPLPALLIGVCGALLATWLRRIATWKKEPIRGVTDTAHEATDDRHQHDMLTTAEGTRLLLTGGRLTVQEPAVARPISGALS